MFLEDIGDRNKWAHIMMRCDVCKIEYRGKMVTIKKQEEQIGHHECKRCSSSRAGKKTAAKMSAIYSQWYSGDGNFAKKPGVGEKISKAQKGKKFSEERKQGLRKPKSKTDKIKEAANRPEEVARRVKRMLENNPSKRSEVREKISKTVSDLYANGKYDISYGRMKTGWVSTDKTPQPIWCRSGLEKEFLQKASKCAKIKAIESSEKLRISYEHNGAKHKYLPDFKVIMIDDTSLIVEIKSTYFALDPKWEPKKQALHKFCEIIGTNYAILSEKEIDKWLEQWKE